MRSSLFAILFLLSAASAVVSCRQSGGSERGVAADTTAAADTNVLTVLTLYGSTTYFMYRGQEMGFQYELALQFAESLGRRLRLVVGVNTDDLIDKLEAGEGDLIAVNLPITKERRERVLYCGRPTVTHQVIVQRAGKAALRDVTELVGKEVYAIPGKHLDRLRHLDEEIGGGIRIHEVDNDSLTSEDLIAMVSRREIDYCVADNDIAQLNTTYFPNLNIRLVISLDQSASWAVRPADTLLADIVDRWHQDNQTSPAYTASHKRYFEISKSIPHSPILSLREGKISPFDDLFRRYAPEIDWDWRLLASLAYTESNFDTTVVSWAGARGLMQLMPRTARAMGVPEGREQDPEESIKAAVKYIGITTRSFSAVPPEERTQFVLAAYNAGLGHVIDAMALTEKYGKNKYVWRDNVERYILLKSSEEYYSDPVCRYGYFRGTETYNFVREIMQRYKVYCDKIPR